MSHNLAVRWYKSSRLKELVLKIAAQNFFILKEN